MEVNEIYLETTSLKTYVKVFEDSKEAANIIFIMTPIVSVNDPLSLEFMEGLVDKKCNVFAMDFLGIGKSEGDARDISYDNMKKSLLSLISYIKEKYNKNIHLYGGTGTGGLIGQALCGDPEINMVSYIQYGVGIYKDISIMGSDLVLKMSYPAVVFMNAFFPKRKLKFNVPKYEGFNAAKENNWYASTMKKYPGAFDFHFSLVCTLLKLFLGKNSTLKNKISCPVLILAAKHDRYYNKSYVEKYYKSLNVQKKIVWIENSHLSFYWNASEMNNEVINWVLSNTKRTAYNK